MVLEARKDAEKVWYQVVWEEIKDADNVIDYNIMSEETKDTSAEINANNQTTTGMATVIPWINAPQLLYDTSIYKWRTVPREVSVKINGSAWLNNVAMSWFVYVISNLDFWSNSSSLTVPISWLYHIHFEWYDQQEWYNPNTWWTNTFTILQNWNDIWTKTEAYRVRCYIDIETVLMKWDIIQFREKNTTWASWTWYCTASLTKL